VAVPQRDAHLLVGGAADLAPEVADRSLRRGLRRGLRRRRSGDQQRRAKEEPDGDSYGCAHGLDRTDPTAADGGRALRIATQCADSAPDRRARLTSLAVAPSVALGM